MRDITVQPTRPAPTPRSASTPAVPGRRARPSYQGLVKRLRDHGVDCEIIFLTQTTVLIQRFSETAGAIRSPKMVEP